MDIQLSIVINIWRTQYISVDMQFNIVINVWERQLINVLGKTATYLVFRQYRMVINRWSSPYGHQYLGILNGNDHFGTFMMVMGIWTIQNGNKQMFNSTL